MTAPSVGGICAPASERGRFTRRSAPPIRGHSRRLRTGGGLYVGSFDPALRFYELPTGELIAAAYLSSWVLGAEAFGKNPRARGSGRRARAHHRACRRAFAEYSLGHRRAARFGSGAKRERSLPVVRERFVPAPPVLETIQRLTADLDPKGSPCRLLPYEAWDHPGLGVRVRGMPPADSIHPLYRLSAPGIRRGVRLAPLCRLST